MDKKLFFDKVREFWGGKIETTQFIGLSAIINEAEARKTKDEMLAYILGTIDHETGRTFEPIREWGLGKNHRYGTKEKYSGAKYTTPNQIYYGRGHTQNTWYEVYENLTSLAKKQGKDWNFLENPDLLLKSNISIWATFEAMEIGLYTGRKLSDYFTDSKSDYLQARRIINGVKKGETLPDKAEKIRDLALFYFSAINQKK